MSSAICFNLDQSKILSSGNGLVVFVVVKHNFLQFGLRLTFRCSFIYLFFFFEDLKIIINKSEKLLYILLQADYSLLSVLIETANINEINIQK